MPATAEPGGPVLGQLEDDHGIALPYFNALVVQLLKKLRIQQTNSCAYPSKEN